MAEFTVSEIIDGNTFEVKNGWKWEDKTGDTVRPCLRADTHSRQIVSEMCDHYLILFGLGDKFHF